MNETHTFHDDPQAYGLAKQNANDELESWNRVHAQLLKSVADAQAKLLAAQNETNDRLESQAKEIIGLNETLHRIRDRLDAFKGQLDSIEVLTYEAGRNSFAAVDMLTPRRPVKRLRTKRIGGSRSHVKRAVERKR